MQPREPRVLGRQVGRGIPVANSSTMLMFKRSQLYLGLALAGLFQIIVRVALR
jgi:hypothetical protein